MQLAEPTEPIRSFIAVDIPPALRSKMGSLQGDLRRGEPDVKWVRPEAIHLTLKFLGSISRDEIERVSSVLAEVVPRWRPFSLKISGLGCFPSGRNPRIVWMGIAEGASELISLQQAIEKGASEKEIPPEDRPFKPHLTLGRIRSPRGRDSLLGSIEKHKGDEIGSFLAQTVCLMRSELKPSGAVYTRLREFCMSESVTGAPNQGGTYAGG